MTRAPALFVRSAVLAASASVAVSLSGLPAAYAQTLSWDWGGEKKINGSGREVVRMAAARKPGDIIVSFSDRKLYFVTAVGEALSYPIATPREESRWQGTIAVTAKRENPSWTPTPTMRRESPNLPSWVPGGHPMNPLGIRALYLGSSTYRIHGTDAPWTIGSAVSKGCVRMYNQDVLDLYPRVSVGASVLVTWEKFKTTPAPDDAIAAASDADESKQVRKLTEPEPQKSSVKTGSLPPKPAAPERTKSAPSAKTERGDAAAAPAPPAAQPAKKPPTKTPAADGPLWI